MSGDTSTCGVHLDGARQLFQHMWSEKKSFSEKKKALYRIYCYLRIIWESTQVITTEQSTSSSPRMITSESVFQRFEQKGSQFSSPGRLPGLIEITASASFECIYGIPESLLALLEKVIRIIDQVDRAGASNSSTGWPEGLSLACDALEQSILDWSYEETSETTSSLSDGPNAEMVRHQTQSFHSALVIFLSQNIRLLDHRYLRHYVEAILESIEAIEKIKANTNMLAAPLFWPAFIAASEAFDAEHQARFRKWYDEVSSYGIAAVRTGIQVIHEVWDQGPSRTRAHTSSWRRVIQSSGRNLMLS